MANSPQKNTRSLTRKLSLVLLAAALLPMLGTAYYTLTAGVDRVAYQEQQNLRLLAATTADRLDQLFGNIRKVVHMLAADQEVVAFLASEQNHERYGDTTQRSLATITEVVPMFENVYLMDRSGVFVATTSEKARGMQFDFRPYFRHAIRGELYVSDLLFGSTTGRAGLYFSGPVRDPEGAIVGVAVVKMGAGAVTEILDGIGAEQVATPMLVDSRGVILHHPEPRLRYSSLGPLSAEAERAVIKEKGLPVERIASLGMDPLWQALLAAKSGGVRFQMPHGGGPQVAGFAHLQTLPWAVVLGEAESRFAEPLNELFRNALFGVSLVAVLVLVVSAGAGRALVRPISRLANAADRIERGEIKADNGPFDPRQLALAPVARRRDELGELARVFESMAGEVYRRQEELEVLVGERTQELADKHAQLEAVHRRVAEELRVAKALQQAILPTRFPDSASYDLFAVMTPAREMGGDFYDFFPLAGGRMGVVVADVSGKGIPAAFFMAVARTEMQNAAQTYSRPGETLKAVNELLCRQNPLELFVTVFYAVFDPQSGHFTYACGGHNPPVRVDSVGRSEFLPGTGGVALGVMEGLDYDEADITLNSGERIVLYTDGITEAFSALDEAFGEERLLAACATDAGRSSRETTEGIIAAVEAFCIGAEPSDDVTCLVLHYSGERQT